MRKRGTASPTTQPRVTPTRSDI